MDRQAMSKFAGILVVGLLALGTACGLTSDDAGDAGGGDEMKEFGAPMPQPALGGTGGNDGHAAFDSAQAGGRFGSGSTLPAVGPSIIKTADLSIEVADGDFLKAVQDVTATAGRFGGFVVSSTTQGEDSKTGTIVLRIPSEDFETTLASVQDLGDVKSQEVTGRDVSQEFVDLEARLRNLQAQESVLLGLMKEAQTIAASIRVQNSLSSVQLDIEQIQGRLNFLEDRAELSTIAVSITEGGAPVPKEPGVWAEAWERAVDVTEAIVYALIVALGFVVPIGILAGLVYLAVRLVQRSLRPRLGSGTPD